MVILEVLAIDVRTESVTLPMDSRRLPHTKKLSRPNPLGMNLPYFKKLSSLLTVSNHRLMVRFLKNPFRNKNLPGATPVPCGILCRS